MDRNASRVIEMNLDGAPSTVVVGPLAGLELGRFVPQPPPVYIVDEAVVRTQPDWLEQIQVGCDRQERGTLELPGGEGVKDLAHLGEVWDWLAGRDVTRDGTIVAVGGGAVLDLAGMAAATWRRGVNFVAIPTTLLSMVDAAIGGKTAINAAGLKNPVGAFHPARGILIDSGFLATLPRQAWRDGMAELIKTALIGDPRLFAELHHARGRLAGLFQDGDGGEVVPGVLGALPWREWIGRAAAVKADVVGRDFRESGPRRALNLGHTLGHALEAWSRAQGAPLSHGQSVAVGTAVIFRVAAERGLCPLATAVQVIELLQACGLPTSHPAPPADELERLLAGDKKRMRLDGLRWVMPRGVGEFDLHGRVEAPELLKWLD